MQEVLPTMRWSQPHCRTSFHTAATYTSTCAREFVYGSCDHSAPTAERGTTPNHPHNARMQVQHAPQ